jgi:hypothetical protein
VTGAPGIGLPSIGPANNRTYALRVTKGRAWLEAGIYANGEPTSYYWQYGTTTAYGLRTPAFSAGSSSLPVTVSSEIEGMKPGTLYHYRLVATNPTGVTYGYDSSLTTGVSGDRSHPHQERGRRHHSA